MDIIYLKKAAILAGSISLTPVSNFASSVTNNDWHMNGYDIHV
jgi:hypothetical protein